MQTLTRGENSYNHLPRPKNMNSSLVQQIDFILIDFTYFRLLDRDLVIRQVPVNQAIVRSDK